VSLVAGDVPERAEMVGVEFRIDGKLEPPRIWAGVPSEEPGRKWVCHSTSNQIVEKMSRCVGRADAEDHKRRLLEDFVGLTGESNRMIVAESHESGGGFVGGRVENENENEEQRHRGFFETQSIF
jgi:hypothetical protein